MKLSPHSHHLDVQLLADEYHSNALALKGRDFSVQCHRQKNIEEGTPIAGPPHV